MPSKYHIYGMGNALVDIVTEVSDQFVQEHAIEKGVMTLVDEAHNTNSQKRFICLAAICMRRLRGQHHNRSVYSELDAIIHAKWRMTKWEISIIKI